MRVEEVILCAMTKEHWENVANFLLGNASPMRDGNDGGGLIGARF